MGSGKKHRKSIQNNSNIIQQMSSNNQLNNGNDSDYGVFSDPEENADYQISAPSAKNEEPSIDITIDDNDIVKEQVSNIELNDVSSSSSSIEQPSGVKKDSPVITSAIETKEVEIDLKLLYNEKSIDTLKYKLENDPDYSSKTTYTTFFSFIILSIEIEYSCSPSIFTLSDISNVIRMIDYIITNHSTTPEVEAYTRNMLDMGIIEHVIRGLIEFNNSRRFDKESIEKFKQSLLHKRHGTHDEHKHKITSETSASSDKTSTDITTVTPTNSKPNRFVQFWRNLSCCCRCRKSRKNSIILDDKLEEKLEEKDNQDQVSKINDDDIKNKYLAQDLP